MYLMLWIVGAAIIYWVTMKLYALVVGATSPLPVLGRNYLLACLKRDGIAGRIPLACVAEIAETYADFLTTAAQNRGEGRMWTLPEQVKCLDAAAAFIRGWIIDGHDYPVGSVAFLADGERPPVFGTGFLPDKLKAYGVALGGATKGTEKG